VRFERDKVAFGRHQTFAVRYGWLSKGFQALKRDPNILRSEEAVAELGVGKNMVESITYWLRAFQLVEQDSFKPTELGVTLFSARGLDPYLEDEATIWLLHWLLASNPAQATAWYWFFNRFHKTEFNSEELLTALGDFVRDQVQENKQPAQSTIKNDATLIPRMYAQSQVVKGQPIEDALDSPLAQLGMVRQASRDRVFWSPPAARPGLPTAIFGFAVAQLFAAKNTEVIPVEDLMLSRGEYPAPGAVFRLTEQELLSKLESLQSLVPRAFQLNDTAGLHQLFMLKRVEPMDMIELHYAQLVDGVAA
jgi:hypothetical protein